MPTEIASTLRQALRLGRRTCGVIQAEGPAGLPRAVRRWLLRRRGAMPLPPRGSPDDYQHWIEFHEPTSEALNLQRSWSETHAVTRFSLITPLYRTPRAWLEELVQSLSEQTYPHWELCLAVADDEPAALRRLVARMAQADSRLKVARIRTNQGISRSSNAALSVAAGEFVGLLDHDDVLAPFALYEMARALEAHPECDLIYSDEDKLSADGHERSLPVLKPDFSPEMLLGHNYLCHFAVLRRSLVEQVGGFRPQYDGAQDWDLFLRIAERTQKIHHIPACLYHWRAAPTSTASTLDAKPDAMDTQRRVIEDHFARQGILAQARLAPNGTFRVTWPLAAAPRVTVIIPNRDKPQLIKRCMAGLLEGTEYPHLEIVIVDNGSTDPTTLEYYQDLRDRNAATIVPFPQSFNYSAMCNAGARAAQGELLLFLNNDTEVLHADWLMEMVRWGTRPGMGVIGAKLLFPEGTLQHAGMVLGVQGLCGHVFHRAIEGNGMSWGGSEWYRNLLAVTGACQLISRPVFEQIGGFDESYRVGYSDVVLCLEAWRAGYRNLYTPYARLIHHECSTRERVDPAEDGRRFAQYLRDIGLEHDPYYNEQLAGDTHIPVPKPNSARRASQVLRDEIERRLTPPSPAPVSDHVRRIYHCRHDVRKCHPEAFLPSGQDGFLHWLREHGAREYPSLREDDVRVYLDRVVNQSERNLAEAWLFNSDWQKRFPLAMTAFGRSEFLKAIGSPAELPEVYTPLEELHLLARCRGDAAQLLNRAAKEGDGTRLVQWARTEGTRKYGLTKEWIDRLTTAINENARFGPSVNLLGPLSYQAGLGAATRGYLKAIQAAGIPCACRNVPYGIETDDLLDPTFLKTDVFDTSIHVFQPDVLARDIRHCGTEYRESNYRVGIWYWELESFPEEWMPAFELLHEIWAPTEFIANTLRKVSPIPVHRMAHAVELHPPAVVTKHELGVPDDHFLFLFVFDIRSVLERKNPWAIIEAFRRAFRPSDKATLLFKVGMSGHDPAGFARLQEASQGLPIKFLTENLSRPHLCGLIQACDCYVSLHRSEGFGLTMAEAMLLGKPVISTNYSGNVDFMTRESSLLVDHEMIEVPTGLPFYKPGNRWADPSVEQAAEHMRWVYSQRDDAHALGERAERHVRSVLSPHAAGAAIRRRLLEIEQARQAPVRRAA